MRIEEYALRQSSAGAGARRGGVGARRVYRILEDGVTFNCYSDRFRIAPWGLFGGKPGATSRFSVERDGRVIELASKGNFVLQRNDRLVIETAGGGGYGPPSQRDPAQVARDLEDGLITQDEAARQYGYGQS